MALQVRGIMIVALLGAPSVAFGSTVAVPPLVAKGVDAKVVKNATDILAMELDFSGAYEKVIEVASAPASLNAACLTSTSCLGGIAKTLGADQVVAGTIGTGADGYAVGLVLYDRAKNTIVRKKSFDIGTDASAMSKAGSKMVREILGQQGKAEETDAALAAAVSISKGDEEDDFNFEPVAPAPKVTTAAKSSATSKPTNTKVTPTVNPQKLEDPEDDLLADPEEDDAALRAADAARAKAAADAAAKAKAAEAAALAAAEEERRIAAERAAAKAAADAEIARRKAEAAKRAEDEARAEREADDARREEEARAAAAASEPSEEDLEAELAAFQFGSSASAIAVESVDSKAPSKTTSPSSTSRAAIVVEEDEEEEDIPPPKPAPAKSTSTSSTATKTTTKPPARIEEDDEEDFLADPDEEEEDIADLDEEDLPPRSSSSKTSPEKSSSRSSASSSKTPSNKSSSSRARPDEDEPAENSLTLYPRLGVARYGNHFTFLTFGGELGIPIAARARVVVGVEGYATQRHYDDEAAEIIADKEGIDVDDVNLDPWNTILPINLGVQYYGGSETVKGYGGLDLVGGAITAEIFPPAIGLRARGGVDFISKAGVGFNLNLGVGGLYGKAFPEVQPDVSEADIFWQLSAGLLFAF